MPGSLQTTFPERAVGTAQLCRILTKKLKVLVLDLLLTATVLVLCWSMHGYLCMNFSLALNILRIDQLIQIDRIV